MRRSRLTVVALVAACFSLFVSSPPVPVATLRPYAEAYEAALNDAALGRAPAAALDGPARARVAVAVAGHTSGGPRVVAARWAFRDLHAGGTWSAPALTATVERLVTYRADDGPFDSGGDTGVVYLFARSGGVLVLDRVYETDFPGVVHVYR